MRVALLTNFIPPYRVPLFQELRRRVEDLRIFLSTPMERGRNWASNWGDLPVTLQRTITWHYTTRHPGGFTESDVTHLPIDMLSQLERFHPDAVISGELGLRSLLAAVHCLRRRTTGLVLWATVSERSEAGRSALRKLLRHWLVRRADAVIVNGMSGHRYMVALGAPSGRIVQMPYSVDLRAFAGTATRPADDAYRLLHVGQMIERKGLMQLLESLARYASANPDRAVEIWFAGDGAQRQIIENGSWPANLRICLLGEVLYAELPKIYAHCGIQAFPTLSDEWGVVVNEAMAAGLPVLGSIHAQAVQELIRDGITGWLFDPDDGHSIDRAVNRALTTPVAALNFMRGQAIEAIATVAPDRMAERMVEACRLAIDSRRH